ncbi:hypothetical protein J6590_053548 [Homalodisca vitripennis]|nr:hypothetical protein J6590_053548 [Homalodisca vitripennis]
MTSRGQFRLQNLSSRRSATTDGIRKSNATRLGDLQSGRLTLALAVERTSDWPASRTQFNDGRPANNNKTSPRRGYVRMTSAYRPVRGARQGAILLTLDVIFLTLDATLLTIDVTFLTIDVTFLTTDVTFLTTDVTSLTHDVTFFTIDVTFFTIDVTFFTIDVTFLTIDVTLLTIDVTFLTLDVIFFTIDVTCFFHLA